MSIRTLLITAALLAVSCGIADAEPETYDFTADITDGPLAGTTTSGSFAFDKSVVVPGMLSAAGGLLTDINFEFNGIAYNSATANTGYMGWDNTGGIDLLLIGDDCTPGSCQVASGTNDWFLSIDLVNGVQEEFSYATSNSVGVFTENATFSPASTPVPEPVTLSLFGAGLAGAAAMRRRKKKV